MSQVGMGGGVISILTIAFQVFKYINHRNVRSHCCGKEIEMGIDVDTPEPAVIKIAPAPVIEPGLVAVLPRPS